MTRPTTKDLAEAAGVSLATVDRVLNKRPNVSQRSKAKVEKAITEIGFTRNLAAVNLVRNKIYKFLFIFPQSGDLYLQQLIEKVEHTNESSKSDLIQAKVIQIDLNDPHVAANYISSITEKEEDIDGIAIMAPESPQLRDALSHLVEEGINVVQFLSGQTKSESIDFVGTDNYAAGSTAGRLIGKFLNNQQGKIIVITEALQALDSIQRRHGFDQVINAEFPNLEGLPTLETHGDIARTEEIINNQFKYLENIIGIYVMCSEARMPIQTLNRLVDIKPMTVIAHERTSYSEDALLNNNIDAIIAQNPGHLVRSALRKLRAKSENRDPNLDQEIIRIEILLKDNL